ncbi:ATPase, AAA-type, core [Cordyceps fumosorosea ARSEF 2679]|uniref:Conserved oligomeric Golgi complex subunit 6 n=1 Tax=Cordyceps fumosorosea (strain ARSEF 2679) TaxID=1081104 RepID=A0A168EGC9_CORFA|nr:ATPase, AAA-type, core [Cordyceps fumosorosea ARSEF 2679]OAA73773.1 ATPase, AAA-type, core [Cordyceps fumosorosea ARSEF 2679]
MVGSASLGAFNGPEPVKAGAAQSYLALSNKAANPLATKVSALLSTSYSDADFRSAVALIDHRGIRNDGKTRRRLRLELQKEVIENNGKVLDDFSSVSDVSRVDASNLPSPANRNSN